MKKELTLCAGTSRPKPDRYKRCEYDVPIKSEYVVDNLPSCLVEEVDLPKPQCTKIVDNNDNNDTNKKGKKRRGQNKKRPRDAKVAFADKVCLAVVRGLPCPFLKTENGCKYNHDLKSMLASRPPDLWEGEGGVKFLQGECPYWKLRGYCDFGVMCRLGSCHINMSTGQNLCRRIDENGNETIGLPSVNPPKEVKELPLANTENPKPGQVLTHQSHVLNVISKETTVLLRKNKYPFICKRHFEVKKEEKKKIDVRVVSEAMDASKPALPLKERKLIDFSNKVYIAPLTTVGNLPYRRVMKKFGADITCGEMALADQLLQGKGSEWALLKRHSSEDIFGVQIASGHADQYTRIAEVLANESLDIDFVDMNLGCPIDLICGKGAGAKLMLNESKLKGSIKGLVNVLNCPVTIKMRTGWSTENPIAQQLQTKIQRWQIDGIGAFMLHGRSRLQRYSRNADWNYISQVAKSQSPDLPQIPVIGNGDIFSYTDYEEKILSRVDADDGNNNLCPTAMLGRGALIKPWLPTEIKERRHWDISATERLDMLKDFVRFGLEHWGSDQQGVNRTRRFLLEWQSFLHRYVPVGIIEVLPQRMNQRTPKNVCGRSDLETIMLSSNCADWIKLSEMLLGKAPEGFEFQPKHKANSFRREKEE